MKDGRLEHAGGQRGGRGGGRQQRQEKQKPQARFCELCKCHVSSGCWDGHVAGNLKPDAGLMWHDSGTLTHPCPTPAHIVPAPCAGIRHRRLALGNKCSVFEDVEAAAAAPRLLTKDPAVQALQAAATRALASAHDEGPSTSAQDTPFHLDRATCKQAASSLLREIPHVTGRSGPMFSRTAQLLDEQHLLAASRSLAANLTALQSSLTSGQRPRSLHTTAAELVCLSLLCPDRLQWLTDLRLASGLFGGGQCVCVGGGTVG